MVVKQVLADRSEQARAQAEVGENPAQPGDPKCDRVVDDHRRHGMDGRHAIEHERARETRIEDPDATRDRRALAA